MPFFFKKLINPVNDMKKIKIFVKIQLQEFAKKAIKGIG
jgi:hypothetical protein